MDRYCNLLSVAHFLNYVLFPLTVWDGKVQRDSSLWLKVFLVMKKSQTVKFDEFML